MCQKEFWLCDTKTCSIYLCGFKEFTSHDKLWNSSWVCAMIDEYVAQPSGHCQLLNIQLHCESGVYIDLYATQALFIIKWAFLILGVVSRVLTVSFHAVPLLSRILPSDACKIFKQGLNIRQVLSANGLLCVQGQLNTCRAARTPPNVNHTKWVRSSSVKTHFNLRRCNTSNSR